MGMAENELEVPLALRRGGRRTQVERAVRDSLTLERLVCRNLGIADLGGKRVLDVGCGWRMAKALLDKNLPIGAYVGVDVFAESIEFLQSSVTDERFSFQLLDAHNAMYNPTGKPLTDIASLPVAEASFDIIWLFSVFTHLAPHDYAAMLKLLRPYVKPDGRLLFSLFINEPTPGGMGFIDSVTKQWESQAIREDQLSNRAAQGFAQRRAPGFVDFDPAQPLKWALYSREHALELFDGTGWEIESVNDPEEAIQHYIVCLPAVGD